MAEDSTYGGGLLTYTSCSTIFIAEVKCRWCGEQYGPFLMACPKCGASQAAAFSIHNSGKANEIKLFHNPDNSLYIEFVAPDDKTARYTLDPEILLKLGALRLFDSPPNGQK